ncbi:hypothetical protein [Devosia sp. MC521]|uniref:hypothetical protein n=1 Tax=Devosia sp. MC521 TaxID=2759954 RepID=UPI0015F9EDDC|nr:hypothetical protein [Devosia sp. MC521]MBJ6987036.1 hypothetical protein [Devosia sp. MC521]QMW64054.1 hypothetical protein H4N61_07030 [Devosia sp. MC521]
MSDAIISAEAPKPSPSSPPRAWARQATKSLVWLLGIPCALSLILYLVLLATPISLPLSGPAVRLFVQNAMGPDTDIEIGDMALGLENGVWPVIRFAPVRLTDRKSGTHIAVDAIEVGFSPARALFGQPGASIGIVGPDIEMVQDLHGPRLVELEFHGLSEDSLPTISVMEGADRFPAIEIDAEGVQTEKSSAPPMRSDNDWLIYNLEAAEAAISDLVEQTAQGRFSRLYIRGGEVAMLDPVNGLFRRLENVEVDIAPVPGNAQRTEGKISATIAGRKVHVALTRMLAEDGTRHLQADVTNIDYANILPVLDGQDALVALRGTGALSLDVTFTPDVGELIGGEFKLDLTGLDLKIGTDSYPIVSSIFDVVWKPSEGRFVLQEGTIQVGDTTASVYGVIALGLDKQFGSTTGIALSARNVFINPSDLPKMEQPFDRIDFYGWSAGLYGAVGIDQLTVSKGDGQLSLSGRADMLQSGTGIDLSLTGHDFSVEDMTRLWPYITAPEARDWVLQNVSAGQVLDTQMRFNFPVGTIGAPGGNAPLPEDSISVMLSGTGMVARPLPSMEPIHISGTSRISIDDAVVSYSGGLVSVATDVGSIEVINPGFVLDNSSPDQTVMELSGDVLGAIPSVVAFAKAHRPQILEQLQLPLDIETLSGEVDVNVVTTLITAPDKPEQVDYVINGGLSRFGSSRPVEGRVIRDAELQIAATQHAYRFNGSANIDGMPADILVEGTPTSEPTLQVASTVSIDDIGKLGIDLSAFLEGTVRFIASPLSDGAIDLTVDLEGAGVNVRDLGIYKSIGRAGTLSAIVRLGSQGTRLENIVLAFDDVRLAGTLELDAQQALKSAEFGTFQLSKGDSASVRLTPLEDGFAVRVRGEQLDLKPVLGRFFSLEQGSGGVEATQVSAPISMDIELDRAIGYYAVTAFNLDVDMLLRGSDLRGATLAAQFSEGNAISITTNPAPNGRTLTVAFNDAGTILRLLGIYSQLAGGSGSLVMTTDRQLDQEVGQLIMRNFAIVDEDKVVQVLGNHSDSRSAIATQNRLDFTASQVDFVRKRDRVEVGNAVLAGATVGGTMRGFIYTDRRQWDLTGTYVPLFGLNNVFQQLPIIGEFLGGREGEGLVGVTFAVNGALDSPNFVINPLSVLAPGFLREFFEFRSRELPPAN